MTALDIDMAPRKINAIRSISKKDRDLSNLKFLLFVADSLSARKLPISGTIYAAMLQEGLTRGGLGKKVASLLGRAKTNTKEIGDILSNKQYSTSLTWEDLLGQIEDNDFDESMTLPLLNVRLGKKEVRLVMAAESPLAYNSRQTVRRTRKRDKSMP